MSFFSFKTILFILFTGEKYEKAEPFSLTVFAEDRKDWISILRGGLSGYYPL